jgi:GTP diphosphokinase / guanosine-3',5'-bis(diphosphate) 3'-diphosphatase
MTATEPKPTPMATLERAIALAATAHAGQIDKAGQPYVLHLVRVMLAVEGPEARIVAVLHDFLEDTDHTRESLEREGFAPEIVDAIEALTKRPGETRLQAAARAAQHPLALDVKLADNADNMDLTRLPNPTEKDRARLLEYARVRELLLASKPS